MCIGTYSPDALNFIYFNFKLSYIFFYSKILELFQKITLDIINKNIITLGVVVLYSFCLKPTCSQRLYRSL